MILRYSITAVCVLAIALQSTAMTQDSNRTLETTDIGEPDEKFQFSMGPERFGDTKKVGRFQLYMTDDFIQALRREGELTALITKEARKKISSIEIRHKETKAIGSPLSIIPHLYPNGEMVFQLDESLLNQLKSRNISYQIPFTFRGKCNSVKLTYQENFRPLENNSLFLEYPRPVKLTDPEIAKFNSELFKLTRQLKKAESEPEKSHLQDDVRALLESEYDRHLENQETKLNQMEKRLGKLREQFNRQKEAKDKLVDMRITSIVSDAEGIGWPNERMPGLGEPNLDLNPKVSEPANWNAPVNPRWRRFPNTFEQPTPAGQPAASKNSETTATPQTKLWLLGMAELAKGNNWDALNKIGHIVMTSKDESGQQFAIDLTQENELLAEALERAAEKSTYSLLKNKYMWKLKLDSIDYKLHVITAQYDGITTATVMMDDKLFQNNLLQNLMALIKSVLADNDANNDSITVELDNENRLIILSGDIGAVNEVETLFKKFLDKKNSR